MKLKFYHNSKDADWTNDKKDRVSVTGFVFVFKEAPIPWSTQEVKTDFLYTCNAEYMALSAVCEEPIWLRSLASEIDPGIIGESTIIYMDKKSAIDLASASSQSTSI